MPSRSALVGLCGLAAALALLFACQSPPSRYSQRDDSAPQRVLDPDQIEDARPAPVQIRAAGNRSPYTVNGKTYRVMNAQEARGFQQQGVASWYGVKFHGHQTSNGEIYDMYGMTAAHKSLPIPCYVRVTNIDNGRSTIVRVNDRGPFHGGRIIDLSYAAATKLRYVDRGTARVRIEVLDPVAHGQGAAASTARAPGTPLTYLQAGALSEEASARSLQRQLLALLDVPVTITVADAPQAPLYRVRIGPLDGGASIDRVRRLLDSAQLGGAFLVYE